MVFDWQDLEYRYRYHFVSERTGMIHMPSAGFIVTVHGPCPLELGLITDQVTSRTRPTTYIIVLD